MNASDRRAVENFRSNRRSVDDLMTFDASVLDVLKASLTSLKERLVKVEVTNPYLQPDKLITLISQIREHESLRSRYGVMYNQALVLSVSYFASAVRDLFVDSIANAAMASRAAVVDEDIKVSVEHLLDDAIDRPTLVAEAIADRGDQSWQDMQSIVRAFTKYFGQAPERDSVVNDIIVAQAVRHVIVHNGAKADRRLLSQIKKALPRSFNPRLVVDEPIQLTPDEVRLCGQSMLTYLQRLEISVQQAAI
jgi:hypothetical protein